MNGCTRRRRALALLLTAMVALACATPEIEDSKRTRPAASDGWIEIVVLDRHVPADPLGDPGSSAKHPPPCELELELGGRRTLTRTLTPRGDVPPYTVDETLRVAAAPGSHRGTLYYSGCRTAWGQLDGRETEVALDVRAAHVTRLEFDGATLLTYPPALP